MKLNLKYDSRLKVPEGVILLSGVKKVTSSVKDGSFLKLTGDSGRQVRLKVGNSPNEETYVSRKTLYTLYKRKPYSVTLGCDPEFSIVDKNGKMVWANEVLNGSKKGEIGDDGSLGEFRPAPGKDEIEVTENLRGLIYRVSDKIKPLGLHVEAHSVNEGRTHGFHIHVGAPRPITSKAALGANTFLKSFALAMDYFVGIPAMLLEPYDPIGRRLGNGNYGEASDVRTSHYGTIEYRTPGGFHLRHPDYTRGILALAQCASKDILNYVEGLSCGWSYLGPVSGFDVLQDRYGLPDQGDILSAFNSKSNDKAYYMLEGIINVVSSLDSYEEHKESIDTFLVKVINNEVHSPVMLDNW